MSVLRSIGKFFGSTIFTISLGLIILMLSIVQLTKPETLQPMVSDIFEKQIATQITPEQLTLLQSNLIKLCEFQNKDTIEYELLNQNISLSCEEIKSSEPSDLPKLISMKFLNILYNKNYGCEFLECVQQLEGLELLTFLLSSTANKFFNSMILYSEIGVIIGLTLIGISVRIWYDILKTVGTGCVVNGLPYFIIPIFLSQLKLGGEISSIFNKVFESVNTNYLITLIIGIILIITGIVGKYFTKKVKKG